MQHLNISTQCKISGINEQKNTAKHIILLLLEDQNTGKHKEEQSSVDWAEEAWYHIKDWKWMYIISSRWKPLTLTQLLNSKQDDTYIYSSSSGSVTWDDGWWKEADAQVLKSGYHEKLGMHAMW